MYNLNNSMMQTQQIIDERQPLERFNRISLFYLMKTCGFDVQDTMPKERMLKLAEAHPERIDFRKVQTYNDGYGAVRVVRPDHIREGQKADAELFEKAKAEYKGVSKKDLMAEAKGLGVDLDYKTKPDEMISAIMAKKAALGQE